MSIPLFTRDWFTLHIHIWEKLLAEFKGRPVRFLEIGSYEGRSCVWLCENILTHPDARIVCVDTFKGSEEMTSEERDGIFERFMYNVSALGAKIERVVAKESGVALREFPCAETFDFIYIDACHRSRNVLEDAVLSFPLLKVGGILLFDDYDIDDKENLCHPFIGVDSFLRCYAKEVEIVMKGYQIAVRKTGA